MKLKSLHIGSYRHLQNINFDFTCPKRHPKSGQPLEKICIIGQSATGKTSVLELIKECGHKLDSARLLDENNYLDSYHLIFKGHIEFLIGNKSLLIKEDKIINDGRELHHITNGGGAVTEFIEKGLRLLYFSTDVISKEVLNIFSQNPINILNEISIEKFSRFEYGPDNFNYILEFSENVNKVIWFGLLYKILDYRKKFTQMASELINKGAIGDINKLNKQYSNWSETNPNPLIPFAEIFNPLLNKLNLEIDLVNTEFTIPINSKIKKEVIPVSGLSTGTKGLLLSMFPLYELDTKEAIVLIDEPERSLFPDIQIDLMQHYQNLAPEAQIVVATHSPFIAVSFDPEERFILYFDNKGEVAVRRGESPKGDDPNDMLRNDFNVDYYNEFGKQAYQKYLSLKMKAKQETEPTKKKELIIELAALGDKYNF
ncbi:MAG: AAA family ATPase [Ginsengibacter sp.]